MKKTVWGIPLVVVVVLALMLVSSIVVNAYTEFQSKTIPINGIINVTSPPPTPNYDYTLSPNISFGITNYEVGSQVSITGTVLVTNIGNQPINSLLVAGMHLPSWITKVEITQTPVPVGSAVQETVTLSGIAPSTVQTINLTGANVLSAGGITITPQS
jgi:hypothetical protein